MAMDFQTHQDEAKQSTLRLVLLLAFGVLAISLVVSALITGLLFYGSGEFQPLQAFAVAAPITTIGIVGTSLVKSSQIKGGGGSYVAASMGGRPVDFNTLDPAEKQLSNIVEEIAIASGMAVPAVYVLDDEPSINAFAAGWSPDNAAIGVTRGTLQHLNRRELQGVIAHEFAHIRNGDTRVKTRIIGWVYGIAIITVLGRILLQSLWWAPRRRDREDNSAMVMLAAAVGLIVIGSVGTLFARMIQAAVSRQREYLADASAVQYTRDPSGIGEALMKIGGLAGENKIRAAHATEASHLFFSPAFGGGFASHPPLDDRITRLLPDWHGEFTEPDPAALAAASGRNGGRGGRGSTAVPPGTRPRNGGRSRGPIGALPGQVAIPGMPGNHGRPGGIDPTAVIIAGSGLAGEPTARPDRRPPPPSAAANPAPTDAPNGFEEPSLAGPSEAHIEYARSLLARIPEPTQAYLHTRQGAVAAVLGLLVSTDPALRPRQLQASADLIGADADYIDAAGRVISDLARPLQLPAIDIALHSIRELPYEYQMDLSRTIQAIESSRPDQDLFRWMLRRVMLRHLEDQHDDGSRRRRISFDLMVSEAGLVYAVISWFNSAGPEQTQAAFEAALTKVGIPPQPVPALEQLRTGDIDAALERLGHLDRAGRERFVTGAIEAVLHDGRTTADEAELIRVVADAVRLPMPPLLPA